jgi:hypothetical protein
MCAQHLRVTRRQALIRVYFAQNTALQKFAARIAIELAIV